MEDKELILEQIEAELRASDSYLIIAKIANESEFKFCVSFIYELMDKEGMNVNEGIGQLEAFLMESDQL